MAALWEENDLFISYLPSSSGYDVMLWATGNKILPTEENYDKEILYK